MLSSTQAGGALQDGCSRLGLPTNTAAELMKFLSVKRTHDQYIAPSKKLLRMSPGAQLDRLWHFMLLNTSVSTAVHEMLGGVVEHRGIDSTDLPGETRLLQRLYAAPVCTGGWRLYALEAGGWRLEGQSPDVQLWREPGTAMHALNLTASPVAGLKHLPGGGRLYITPNLSDQAHVQLVRALQLLYADGTTTCDSSAAQPQQPKAAVPSRSTRAAAAAATAAAAAAAGEAAVRPAAQCLPAAALPGQKRAGNEQPASASMRQYQQPPKQQSVQQSVQQRQDQGQPMPAQDDTDAGKVQFIIHNIAHPDGPKLGIKLKRNAPFDKAFQAAVDTWSLEYGAVRFLFDGLRLCDSWTPEQVSMEDGDVVLMMMHQTGC